MCGSDRVRHTQGRARALLLACAACAAAFLSGCMPYELRSVLDGPEGKALSISPSATVVIAGDTIGFTAAGGVGPYVYAVMSGPGSFGPGAGVYNAVSAGTAVIRVTDKTGKSVNATVTIQPAGTSLQISPSSITISIGASITFVPIGGTVPYAFSITTNNSGANPMVGAVYVAGSTPNTFDTVSLTDGASTTVTASVHVVPVSAVNYDVTGASSFPGPGKVSSALPGGWSFTLKNIGSSTGTSADWKVYLCANNFLAGGDFVLASGTENSLSASGSVNKTVTGTFPAVTPGSYYIIVQVSSADDTTPANNTLVTGPITLIAKDIDYVPSAVVPNPAFLVAGGPMNGTFDIVNTGEDDGGATVFWQVRASLGTTPSAGDYILDGASITGGLHAGLPATTITVNGTWPSTPASWHLIVVIVAVDDIDHTNDITATIPTFTTTNPPAPDYTVDAPSAVLPATGTVSALVSATPGGPYHFSIRNTSLNTGAQQIYWKVYASNDEILDASDVLIDSGNIPFLPGSGSSGNINFDGTWPSTGAYYHFIIVADAGDDTNPSNDNLISGPIEVPNIVTETENGDAVGPYPGTLANANDFGNLGLNQLLKVTGVTDGKNTYDTFKINVGAGSGTLEVKAVWATGTDAIDLYAWDETGLQGSAVDTTVNIEEIIWILPHTGAWYIAVKQITNPPTSGYAYSLYIRPLP